VSRSFELLQLAYVQTFQQPVWTTLNVRSSFKISFQTQIWEDCCNRPDDVDSRLDALLLKASSQFKFNRPDAIYHGLDAQSLYKEITCSGRGNVRTTMPHRPEVALKQERFSAKFSEFRSHSCLSRRLMTTF